MSKSRKHWQICEECGIKTRSQRLGVDGFLCYNCWKKNSKNTVIELPINKRVSNRGYSLQEALDKEYTIVSTGSGWHCYFSQVLAGYKFKISLIKKDD